MPRVVELDWWSYSHPKTEELWTLRFTGPGLCRFWDDSWVGLTVFNERIIYLDPRPSVHRPSIDETAQHEILHSLIGTDFRRHDEHFIRRVSPGLNEVLPIKMPPLPHGIERLRRLCYRKQLR